MDQLIGLRHWLHAHPEISRHEIETARHMRHFLELHATPDRIVPLAGAGFAAIYDGASDGKTVMIRCELDALPIHEINDDLPYRSRNDGVGHKCGHDGHMTILAGLAQSLSERPRQGRVVLLFQPDEETGSGARDCCAHANFAQIRPDYVFALHNLPGFSAGDVVCKTATFASHVRYAAIHMAGKEAHSAQPETGISPSNALAELTLRARDIQAKYDDPDAYALLVPVYTHMGVQASGISPARGEVHFTLRAPLGSVVDRMWHDLMDCATDIARQNGLSVTFDIREEFAATMNDADAVEMIRQAARQTGQPYVALDQPFRWGEDFGEFTKHGTGAMFGLGAGKIHPDLHNPDYDFPDDIIANGIAMFAAIVEIATSQP